MKSERKNYYGYCKCDFLWPSNYNVERPAKEGLQYPGQVKQGIANGKAAKLGLSNVFHKKGANTKNYKTGNACQQRSYPVNAGPKLAAREIVVIHPNKQATLNHGNHEKIKGKKWLHRVNRIVTARSVKN